MHRLRNIKQSWHLSIPKTHGINGRFRSTLNQLHSKRLRHKSNKLIQYAAVAHRNHYFSTQTSTTATQSQQEQTTADTRFSKTYLTDYTPPKFLVNSIDLDFDIHDGYTIVRNKMTIRNNADSVSSSNNNNIELAGDLSLNLEKLIINGHSDGIKYDVNPTVGRLSIEVDENRFYNENKEIPIEIVTRIIPEKNTSLDGLYKSKSMYCTQCEAEGFRKITYFFDRPDVTTKYTTTIRGDKDKCPVLLSNGNPIESGDLENNRHFVKWQDPFAKPCYLFALVAGNLQFIEKTFVTDTNKKDVILRIYTEPHNIDKCDWAMQSLVQSFMWDEARFGLEYDLERYNVVAVDDFNMGAMENKSLNIFNSKYVLANNDIATDTDYHNIQRVIGHEYFHNYTGNRVTLRDWFQLSLKEGLTVFRDQEFSSDLNDRGVERIDQVKMLQATQFREDGGPMAHPVRPQSYIEINNFYTVTVYEKGAELVRMIETIVGKETFTKGLQHYLSKHDGQACRIEDFVNAMEHVSNGKHDLNRMYNWYEQSGTPEVKVLTKYDSKNETFTLHLIQSCPDTPDQPSNTKKPFLIPLKTSLLKKPSTSDSEGDSGNKTRSGNANVATPYSLITKPESKDGPFEKTLLLDEKEKSFTFYGIKQEPLLSINRNFSAPVYIQHGVTSEDLSMLAVCDTDSFNRWNAINKLYSISIIENYMKNMNMNTSDESQTQKMNFNMNHHLRECVNNLLRRFIPESIRNEYQTEQESLKRKDLLRAARQKIKEKQPLQQFIGDEMNENAGGDNSISSFDNLEKDFQNEQLIDDLVGERELPRDRHLSNVQIARNPLLTSRLLQLPAFDYLFPLIAESNKDGCADPTLLVKTIENLRCELGYQLYPQFLNAYTWSRDQISKLSLHPQYANNSYEGWENGRKYRSLLNICLRYINCDHESKSDKQNTQSRQILFEQYQLARNMTEMMGSLEAIVHCQREDLQTARLEILNHFYRHFEKEPLVVQKWLRLQSTACHPDALTHVYNLLEHEAYDSSNPNSVYALIGGFIFGNPLNFHSNDGKGYTFLGEQVKFLDEKNPSVAARMCKAFENVEKLDKQRQIMVSNELDAILQKSNLSKGTFEIAKKILDGIQTTP